jgi:hypothetical protein
MWDFDFKLVGPLIIIESRDPIFYTCKFATRDAWPAGPLGRNGSAIEFKEQGSTSQALSCPLKFPWEFFVFT